MSFDEDADREPQAGSPLPPDDRLWRHPSELGARRPAPPPPPPRPPSGPPAAPVASIQRSPRTWGLMLASAAVGAAAAAGAFLAIGVGPDTGDEVREWLLPAAEQREPAEIAEDVLPSVVRLEATAPHGPSIGSGVVFRDDGHVLTTADLLHEATGVVAVLQSGERVEAQLVGADPKSDVAVVKIDPDLVPVAPLGSVAGLQEGEATISIGSASGPGRAPLVSRTVVDEVDARLADARHESLYGMLRLNATGGVLPAGSVVIDQAGAVIGLTTARQPSVGLSTTGFTTAAATPTNGSPGTPATFATPVDYARKIADDLIATGQAQHVWLGVERTDSELVGTGARVYTVEPDSPAAHAGLAPDDVLLTVGGRRVHSMSEVIVALREHRPGDTVDVEYQRGEEVAATTVTLAPPP